MHNKGLVWNEAENMNQTKVSLHCYKMAMRGADYNRHEGNKSLCGQIGITEDGENFLPIQKMRPDPLDVDKACKTCLKIYKKKLSTGK